MQDDTPLHGDCFPESVAGVFGEKQTKKEKVQKYIYHNFRAAAVFFCIDFQKGSVTRGCLSSSRLTEMVDSLRYSGGEENPFLLAD